MPRQNMNRRDLLKKSFLMMAGAQAIPGLLAQSARAHSANDPQTNLVREPAISTVHPEADVAAQKAFANGGNAVDAAIAAMMALCVVIPTSVGFGGYGGSMVVYEAKHRRVTAVDFDSRAPLEFRPELFQQAEQAKHGYLAVGVPGIVAGFDFALRKFGRLKWRTVSEHAALLADEGFEVPPGLSKGLKALARDMDPESLKAYFPTGKAPELGERWAQKDLAHFIRALGKHGPETFYHGDIARQIIRQVRANGGVLSEKDLKSYKPEEVSPLQIDYRGSQIFTPPPPSGGLTSLSILKTLEQFEVGSMEPWGADYFHRFAEAAKLCWA
ncbi:MAG TPA: gamma-glutamyltransferase, partial [Verrucomicrobiae bacterium]|nr:gamma-glutamyltransferase [Verrucomicrobiae bacterium]